MPGKGIKYHPMPVNRVAELLGLATMELQAGGYPKMERSINET